MSGAWERAGAGSCPWAVLGSSGLSHPAWAHMSPAKRETSSAVVVCVFFFLSSGTSFLLFLLYEFNEALPGSGSLLSPSPKHSTDVLHPGWDQSSAFPSLLPSHKMPARAQH